MNDHTAKTIVLMGNSTIARHYHESGVAEFMRGDLKDPYSIIDISVSGHTIQQQKAAWLKLDNKKDADAVFIQLGLNNLHPPAHFDDIAAACQALIDTIRRTGSPDLKIVIATMIPCRKFWTDTYGAEQGLICYGHWKALNEAIMGRGEHAINHVDYRLERHTIEMNDGHDNLNDDYNTGDNLHENNAGRKFIAEEYCRLLDSMSNPVPQ